MNKKLLILLGLSAYTMAATTSRRLAQLKGTDPTPTPGGDPVDHIELCDCQLSGTVGAGFASAGQGKNDAFGLGELVSEGEEIETIPDTLWYSQCESECCACNAGEHNAAASATRTKHFDISGSIEVAETIEWEEAGSAHEESRGMSRKETACITNNQNGVAAAPVRGEHCVCPEPGNGAKL